MKANTIRRAHLREAFFMLVLARLAVQFIQPARVFAFASKPPRRIRRFAGNEADWIGWAVETVGANRWIRALCLPRALAAHMMLRRRGIESRICLGVARQGGALVAHAWVEMGDKTIVGGQEAPKFTVISTFGAAR